MARGFSLVEWFLKLAGNGTDAAAKGACSLAILVVWTVWCERNARIFNDEERTTDSLAQDTRTQPVYGVLQMLGIWPPWLLHKLASNPFCFFFRCGAAFPWIGSFIGATPGLSKKMIYP